MIWRITYYDRGLRVTDRKGRLDEVLQALSDDMIRDTDIFKIEQVPAP
jgi:hypothetical protein